MTIVEFLLARIAADEAVAQAINLPALGGWETAEGWDDASGGTGRVESSVPRALAECAAKRAIVTEHETVPVVPGSSDTTCAGCGGAFNGRPCPTLAHLAAVYSTHPDYQTEWSTT